MKVLVIGNCQARPLASILSRTGACDLLDPIIVHLATPEQEQVHDAAMDEADLILSQLTSPAFKPGHLASARIKDVYPGKTLIWPNLFYSGQQPFLRYMTHPQKGRVLGPMAAYHDLRIFGEWRHARGTGDLFADGPEVQRHIHDTSLAALAAREAKCDAGVSDLIAERHTRQRLFYTFNHPSRWLLAQLGLRICEKIDLKTARDLTKGPEPLNKVIPPSAAFETDIEPDRPDPILGRDVDLSIAGKVSLLDSRYYDRAALRDAAFECYDHMAEFVLSDSLRLTPGMAQGEAMAAD